MVRSRMNSLTVISFFKKKYAFISKKMKKDWREPVEFLSIHSSKGPNEEKDPYSEFVSYDGADLDIKFLLALKRAKHKVTMDVSIPNVHLCIDREKSGDQISYSFGACKKEYNHVASIRSGILLFSHTQEKRLYLPPNIEELINRCSTRFVVFNFGVSVGNIQNGHSNAFIVDRHTKSIIRFDPSGNNSFRFVKRVMAELLPGWKIEQHAHRIPIQTNETDSFQGMCVTFSLLYVLVTLMNPSRSPKEIHKYLQFQKNRVLKVWVLRLNRYIADTLRSIERGTLTRSGVVYIVKLPLNRLNFKKQS